MSNYLRLALALLMVCAQSLVWAAKPAPTTNKPPTVAITAPANGATFTAPATLTMSANAADSDGSVAKVAFYQGATLLATVTAAPYQTTWNAVPGGSYTLTAKATDNAGAVTTSAPVAVTVTVTVTGAKIIVSSPANGATMGSAVDIQGTYSGNATSRIWVDNGIHTRLANPDATPGSTAFTVYSYPLHAGANTLTLTEVRADGTSDTASLSLIGDGYPRLALIAPTARTFAAPATIDFHLEALSPAGSISKVELRVNGALLTSLTTPPYQFSWTNVPKGSYNLYIFAVDNLGNTKDVSFPLTVGAPNVLPTVSLTAPANNAVYPQPATITLSANAADADGTISTVDFYRGSTLLGSTNIAPYSLVVPNVAAGSYSLTARATDNNGGITTSTPVSITVSEQLPVVITSPASGASFTAPAAINLTAQVDGQALGVNFYTTSGGSATLIGQSASTSSPYALTWNVANVGTYTVIAKAVIAVVGFPTPFTISSEPVTITVAPNPSGETITYLHNDFAGSVIAATDANGAVLWKEDYQPYGERISNSASAAGNRQFFTGKPLDAETGLSYFGARYYDQAVGRFMGIDPVGFDEKNIHSFSRYAYGNNNPYRYVDPNGMWAEDIVLAIPGLVMGAHSLGSNLSSGNFSGGLVDALGMVADGVAIALPGVPGGVGLAIAATRKTSSTAAAGKVFSKEKQDLVEMAKADKKTGMTAEDMQAYKDLNKQLPDPFPTNKVRGPEAHQTGAASSKAPHGHVGPVDHIPIIKANP